MSFTVGADEYDRSMGRSSAPFVVMTRAWAARGLA